MSKGMEYKKGMGDSVLIAQAKRIEALEADYDALLKRDTDNLKRLIACQKTIERVRGLPEKLRDVAEDVGLSGNDEDANRLAHITDELEAILRVEGGDE